MTTPTDLHLRYPIGRVEYPHVFTAEHVADCLRVLRELPATIEALVTGLTSAQLNTPYRPGGWTVKQVVHHLADSHMNAYIRVKFALTEPGKTILPYEEQLWAELPDAVDDDLAPSLSILRGVHRRLDQALVPLTVAQLGTYQFHHPVNGPTPLTRFLTLYRWHSLHHTAHIRQALANG